jgi:type IV pilus assembly protein PilV
MLIEALIAILIFSIGILGIVGLQASAVRQSTDARYRAEAAHLAQLLMGQMWTGDRTAATLKTQYNTCTSGCAGYLAWLGTVQGVLPGVDAGEGTTPAVNVSDDGVVTITIYWRSPGDEADAAAHRYDVQAQIGQ